MELTDLEIWIWWAGVGQIVLIIASIAIPKVLNWEEKLAHVDNLTRQMFWVYSFYIWGTNLWFGIISTVGSSWLVGGSPLAAAVNIFICLYWGFRVIIQFTYFDRSQMPKGWFFESSEWALIVLFVGLTFVYGTAAYLTISQLG